MKKTWKTVLLLILVLSLGLLCSCGTAQGNDDPTADTIGNQLAGLSPEEIDRLLDQVLTQPDEALTKEIERACAAENIPGSLEWADKSFIDGIPCYGTFHGCTVFLLSGILQAESWITVAGEWFFYPHSFVIYAFYDGALYSLDEAYENGYISAEDVRIAAEHHRVVVEYRWLSRYGKI